MRPEILNLAGQPQAFGLSLPSLTTDKARPIPSASTRATLGLPPLFPPRAPHPRLRFPSAALPFGLEPTHPVQIPSKVSSTTFDFMTLFSPLRGSSRFV